MNSIGNAVLIIKIQSVIIIPLHGFTWIGHHARLCRPKYVILHTTVKT